jgi:hypothetical protein
MDFGDAGSWNPAGVDFEALLFLYTAVRFASGS